MRSVSDRVSLTDQAIQYIEDAILSGELSPNELYTASDLGRQINVSRTPVREALQELERRGLVVIEKNRGVRVVNTSVESLIEVFQVRLMLEVPLSRRATEIQSDESRKKLINAYDNFKEVAEKGDSRGTLQADRDFHRALLEGARNDRAKQILQEQRDFVLTTGMGTVPGSRTALECFEDHRDIMENFLSKNPEAVGEAIGRHICNTALMLIKQETKNRPEFASIDAAREIGWIFGTGSRSN